MTSTSASISSSAALPNPTVYLNYLVPSVADEWEVTRNIYLATLGALLWDMLSSLPQDYILLRKFNLNVLAYFLARGAALGYVLTSVIAKTARLPNCSAMELGVTCCWVISNAASAFLFLRRVHAIVNHEKRLYHFFSFLYVVDVGLSVMVPIGSFSGPLADTGYCINTGVKVYVTGAAVFPLIFDSLVFFTISYVVTTSHGSAYVGGEGGGGRIGWGKVVSGETLPRLSRAVFHGGQQYYLITVGVNLAVTILIASPSIPPILRATFTIPGVALTSSMACRVFRNLYFEARNRERHGSSIFDSIHFASSTGAATRRRPSIALGSQLRFGNMEELMASSSAERASMGTGTSASGLEHKHPVIRFETGDVESGFVGSEGHSDHGEILLGDVSSMRKAGVVE